MVSSVSCLEQYEEPSTSWKLSDVSGTYYENKNPLKGFIASTHKLTCPTRLLPPPPAQLALDQNQAPTSFKTPPSPHRLFDLQDSLDKRIHFPPQLSEFVPLRNGFYSFSAQTA